MGLSDEEVGLTPDPEKKKGLSDADVGLSFGTPNIRPSRLAPGGQPTGQVDTDLYDAVSKGVVRSYYGNDFAESSNRMLELSTRIAELESKLNNTLSSQYRRQLSPGQQPVGNPMMPEDTVSKRTEAIARDLSIARNMLDEERKENLRLSGINRASEGNTAGFNELIRVWSMNDPDRSSWSKAKDITAAFFQNPFSNAAQFAAQSSYPLAEQVALSALPGGRVISAAAAGADAMDEEKANIIIKFMQDKGVDVHDPYAVQTFFEKNPEILSGLNMESTSQGLKSGAAAAAGVLISSYINIGGGAQKPFYRGIGAVASAKAATKAVGKGIVSGAKEMAEEALQEGTEGLIQEGVMKGVTNIDPADIYGQALVGGAAGAVYGTGMHMPGSVGRGVNSLFDSSVRLTPAQMALADILWQAQQAAANQRGQGAQQTPPAGAQPAPAATAAPTPTPVPAPAPATPAATQPAVAPAVSPAAIAGEVPPMPAPPGRAPRTPATGAQPEAAPTVQPTEQPVVQPAPALGNVEPAPTYPGREASREAREQWLKDYGDWSATHGKTHWLDGTPRRPTSSTPAPAPASPVADAVAPEAPPAEKPRVNAPGVASPSAQQSTATASSEQPTPVAPATGAQAQASSASNQGDNDFTGKDDKYLGELRAVAEKAVAGLGKTAEGETKPERIKYLAGQADRLRGMIKDIDAELARRKQTQEKPAVSSQTDEETTAGKDVEENAPAVESVDDYKKQLAKLEKARDAEFKKYQKEKGKKEKKKLSKKISDIDSQIRELQSSIEDIEDREANLNKPEDDANVVTEDPYDRREIDDPVANERKRIAIEYAIRNADELGIEKDQRRDNMELVDNPGTYHGAVEQKNKAGLRIGDIVTVNGEKAIVLSVKRDIDGMSDHTVLLEPGVWTPPSKIKKTGKNIFDGDTGELKAKGIAEMKERLAKIVSKGRGKSFDAYVLRYIIAKREGKPAPKENTTTLAQPYYNQFTRIPGPEYGFESDVLSKYNKDLYGDDNSPGILGRLEDASSEEEAMSALSDLRKLIESAASDLLKADNKDGSISSNIEVARHDIHIIGIILEAYGSAYVYAKSGDVLEKIEDQNDGWEDPDSKFDFEFNKASPFVKSIRKSKSTAGYRESNHAVDLIPGYSTEDGETTFNPPINGSGIGSAILPIAVQIIEARIALKNAESTVKEYSKKKQTKYNKDVVDSAKKSIEEKKDILKKLYALQSIDDQSENYDEAGKEPNPSEDPADVAERERAFAEDDAARPETTDAEREINSIRIGINDLKKKIRIQKEVAQEADEQQAMADDTPASIKKAARENKKLDKLQAELKKLEAKLAESQKPESGAKPVVESEKPASNEPEKAAEKVTDELEHLVEVGDLKSAKQVFERVLEKLAELLPDAIKRAGFENVEFVSTGKLSGNVLVDGKSIGVIEGGFFRPNKEYEKRFVSMRMQGVLQMTPAQMKRAVERSIAEHLAKTSKGYNKYVVRIPGDGTFKIDANPVSMRELVQNIRREGPAIWKNIAGYKAETATEKPATAPSASPIDIKSLKQSAREILKKRGINPDSDTSYELWFRHFDGDEQEILDSAENNDGDILPWLYETAEIAAEPDTEYSDAAAKRLARRFLKQPIEEAKPDDSSAKNQESMPEKPTPAQEAEFARKAAELDRRRAARRLAQETNQSPLTRRRGPEQVVQRIVNELRRGGTMTVAQVNTCIRLIEALIDNGYLDNLAVSPSESVNYDATTKGEYDVVNQVVRLFVMNIADDGTGRDVGENFIHEVAHHLERMLPESDIIALRQDLTRARSAWLKNKKGLRELLGDGDWLQKSWTDKELDAHVDKMIAEGKMTEADRAPFWEMLQGVMKRDMRKVRKVDPKTGKVSFVTSGKYSMAATKEAYKLMNTSEWFAVNIARIATERDLARPNPQGEIAIWSRLRNLMSRFYGAIVQFLGRQNAERIWNNFQEGRYEAEFQRYNMAFGDDGRVASMQEDPENMRIPGGKRDKFLESKKGQEPVVKPIKWWTDIGHNPDADQSKIYLWAIDKDNKMHVIPVKDLADETSFYPYRNSESDEYNGPTHMDWAERESAPYGLLSGPAHGRIDDTGEVTRISMVGRIKDDNLFREQVKERIAAELGKQAKDIRGYDFTDIGYKEDAKVFSREGEAGFTRDNEPNHDNVELGERGFLTKIAAEGAAKLNGMTVSVTQQDARGYDGNSVFDITIKNANGKIVGQIDYRIRPDGLSAYVMSSDVTKSMRNKGYGKILYAEMGERMRRAGIESVDGTVTDKSGRPIKIRLSVFGKNSTEIVDEMIEDGRWQREVETQIDPNRRLSVEEKAGFERDREIGMELIKQSKKFGGGSMENFVKAMDNWARSVLKPGNMNSISPAILAAMTWQTARAIKNGMTEFTKWAKSMIKNFGPNIKGSLPALWRGAKYIANNYNRFPAYRYFMGTSSRIWDIVDRNPQSPSLRRLANFLMSRTGPDAEATQEDIPSRIKRTGKQFSNLYSRMMERFSLKFSQMNKDERKAWDIEFRKHIIEGTTPSDPDMAIGVEQYRALMRALLEFQRAAGLDVGDVGLNFMPRSYSKDDIEADYDGFIAAAKVAYRMRNDRLWAEAEERLDREMSVKVDELRQADIDKGRAEKTDAEYKAIADKWYDAQQQKIEEEYNKSDTDFQVMAEQWGRNITQGKISDLMIGEPDRIEGKTDSIESRVFNDAEAALLDKYMIKDVDELTARYIRNAVRKSEVARVFGKDGKGYTKLMNEVINEGVPFDYIEEMHYLTNKALGLGLNRFSKYTAKAMDWINVVIASSYLGMSFMYNMFLEPVAFGIRTNLLLATKAFALTWMKFGRIIADMSPEQRQLMEANFGSGRAFTEELTKTLGESLGLIENELERYYSDSHWDYSENEGGSKWAKALAQRIYRSNLMMATEQAKVEASISVAMRSIRDNCLYLMGEHPLQKLFAKVGVDATAPRSTATFFNQIGIPEAEHAAFAKFVASMDGMNNSQLEQAIMEPGNPMAALYRQAVSRMSLSMSVKASNNTRIADADSVAGRIIMQLMNYTYAFFAHNVEYIYRSTKAAITEGNMTKIDRMRYLAPLLGGIMTIVAAYGQQELRHLVDPSEGTRSRQDETMTEKVADAVVIAGAFPPPVQIIAKASIQRKVPGGPIVDVPFQIGYKTIKAVTSKGDAAKRALAEQVIETGVKPVFIGGAASINPALGFVANTIAQREEFTETLADLLTGPEKKPKKKP